MIITPIELIIEKLFGISLTSQFEILVIVLLLVILIVTILKGVKRR